MAAKDFDNKNIFELMAISLDKLKEIPIKEFAELINGKKVNIHPYTDINCLAVNGNIYISATHANIFVEEETDGYRISMWAESTAHSQLYVNLSEKFVFGVYSFEDGKNYRIAFEGNSPDLLISSMGGRINNTDK